LLRSFFIGLSTNKTFRAFSERSPMGRKVSRRFVAGMSVEEAIDATAALNAEGIDVSLDSLGESVMHVSQAEESAAIYHQMLDAIEARKLRANVSLKLTQMGMDIGGHGAGPNLAERIVGEITEHAARIGSFVRIDMEGSEYTEATLNMTERLNKTWPGAVGTVLQAYLFRTEQDARRLLEQGIRIRLCKGAYKEPADIAFPAKADVDANYVKLMKLMVTSPVFCGIATHDEAIVDQLRSYVADLQLDKKAFEFQMLYGIRRDLQFGSEWYPYFMRRLAERPANVIFLAKNFFKN
jgi:proline dehydrogenase